jgi:hypothetical protein
MIETSYCILAQKIYYIILASLIINCLQAKILKSNGGDAPHCKLWGITFKNKAFKD